MNYMSLDYLCPWLGHGHSDSLLWKELKTMCQFYVVGYFLGSEVVKVSSVADMAAGGLDEHGRENTRAHH
jgi:hypothetical protein